MNRLQGLPTLRVDPARLQRLTYRGKKITALFGDTVATALFANGIRIFSRSIKYHRPRGLYSLDGECSNTMMEVDGIPNVFTETLMVRDGMVVSAQNVAGTLENDRMGFMDKLGWAMPAGFYYRIFHKPHWIWPFAAEQIRKVAGFGRLSPDFEMNGRYDEIYPRAEVCVIGGGPAGMTAALTAADQGLRVILLESRPWLGGFFEYRTAKFSKTTALHERARNLAADVSQVSNIRVFVGTSLIGLYPGNLICAFQRGTESDSFTERYLQITAGSVVTATGCIERPLVFENNDRPGVMQISCAHRLARTWGLMPGKAAVFSVGHDLGLEAAVDLFDLGLSVVCVSDIREDGQDHELVSKLEIRNIPIFRGWVARKAHGGKTVKGVTISNLTGTGQLKFACDVLVTSAGLTPVTGMLTLVGAGVTYDDHTGFFLPVDLPEKTHAAGRMLGLSAPSAVEASGRLAGLKAAADCGAALNGAIKSALEELDTLAGPDRGLKLVTAPVTGKKSFICLDEDTTLKDINHAIETGFDMPELIKRFTAAGTGPSQGGTPGHNLPLYVAQTKASPHKHPKPTTVRPPLVPTLLATYAGSNHDMCKRTPVHDSQTAAGGKMERIGSWYRVRCFTDDTSAREEIENVRYNVGMLDASTLGKFRIYGPDAIHVLQRVYIGNMTAIANGKVKYSAMCNEDGCIIDDGVVVKRGHNDYYLTTSTNRAAETVEWIRYHTRYEDWNFHIVKLTDAFGVINLAGPNARKVLEKVTDADVSNTSFPFSGYNEFLIAKEIPVRVMRLGFIGELSYELHVPASYMQTLWDLLEDAGKEFGIRNFGLEAQNSLRLEKGHMIIGSESEQRTTLHDIGLGSLWHRDKPEAKTVGAVALRQTEHQKGRLKLVGITTADSASRPPKDGSPIVDNKIRGYVCTARYSYTLATSIGLALVEDALAINDNRLAVFEDDCNGEYLWVNVVPTPFYDPDGKRLRI